MIWFAPRLSCYKPKLSICSSFLIYAKQLSSEFRNKKVFLVTLAVLVYSFNNQATTGIPLIRQINKCSFAVCMFIFSRTSAFKFTGVFFPDIDECNVANDSCHENAWCNNTQGSFNCFCAMKK